MRALFPHNTRAFGSGGDRKVVRHAAGWDRLRRHGFSLPSGVWFTRAWLLGRVWPLTLGLVLTLRPARVTKC